MKPSTALRIIKSVHTLVWAFFVGCILAIPIFGYAGKFVISSILVAVVMFEVLVIAFNHGICPLTPIAARYTSDRKDNFDIYLPVWLAKYNKFIFGALFVIGVIYMFLKWLSVIGTL